MPPPQSYYATYFLTQVMSSRNFVSGYFIVKFGAREGWQLMVNNFAERGSYAIGDYFQNFVLHLNSLDKNPL